MLLTLWLAVANPSPFEEAEAAYTRFSAVTIVAPDNPRAFKESLAQKSKALDDAVAAFAKRAKIDERAAADCRSGEALLEWANALVAVPPPQGLTAEQGDLFKEKLREMALAPQAEATARFQSCAQGSGAWAMRCQGHLDELKGVKPATAAATTTTKGGRPALRSASADKAALATAEIDPFGECSTSGVCRGEAERRAVEAFWRRCADERSMGADLAQRNRAVDAEVDATLAANGWQRAEVVDGLVVRDRIEEDRKLRESLHEWSDRDALGSMPRGDALPNVDKIYARGASRDAYLVGQRGAVNAAGALHVVKVIHGPEHAPQCGCQHIEDAHTNSYRPAERTLQRVVTPFRSVGGLVNVEIATRWLNPVWRHRCGE